MAFEIPMDLIRQVQIDVRIDAGLSTYDPHDPSLSPLPPLDASIAGLDPSSPADLRCQNCKGKLLRGIESLLCIYCGEKQTNKDLSGGPISFNSTFAYKWLLHSLDLDQSETIGPSIEEFKLKRGQSIPKKEISLHDLLNLPITRPNESENPEANVTNKTLEQSSSSLNLTGDLDNIFSGSKRFIAYGVSEEPVIAKQIESDESKVSVSEENLSFFQSVPSAGSAVRSSEENSSDSLSGSAEGFQSANKLEGSKSSHPFIGSVVDLSSDMDSVSGRGKDQKPAKLEDYSERAQSTADWMHDDLTQQVEHFDSGGEAKDNPPPDNFNNPSSEGVD